MCLGIHRELRQPSQWLNDPVKLKLGAGLGEKTDIECGSVLGARQAGLSILETADLPGFSHTNISRV